MHIRLQKTSLDAYGLHLDNYTMHIIDLHKFLLLNR